MTDQEPYTPKNILLTGGAGKEIYCYVEKKVIYVVLS
jgi:hypothetical protein